jgi:uncharacterized damage-inducible protein DinB
MDLLDRLLDHDRWATTQLLDSSRSLTDAQLDREFEIGFRTLRATFDHMVLNVDFWTGLMVGRPIAYRRDASSVGALIEDHERSYSTFATYARRARDERRLDETFVDHYEAPMTFGGAILHVILHNDEHRTEATHILQRLGVPEVPEVDHGLWDFRRRGF